MTNPAKEAPAAEKKAKPRRKIGPAQKRALLAVIERKKLGSNVDYKAIAARMGLSAVNIRKLYSDYTAGKLDLGAPETVEELQIDVKAQHQQQVALGRRHKAIMLRAYEAKIYEVEDLMGKGKDHVMAFKETGLTDVLRELKAVCGFIDFTEKGFLAALEEIASRMEQRRVEKNVDGKVVSQSEAVQMQSASEGQRALRALEAAIFQADAPVPPAAEGGVPPQD